MGISFLNLYILWVHPEKSAHENYLVILFLLVHYTFRTLFLTFRELALIFWNSYVWTLTRILIYKCLINFNHKSKYSEQTASWNKLYRHTPRNTSILQSRCHQPQSLDVRLPTLRCYQFSLSSLSDSLSSRAGVFIQRSWSEDLRRPWGVPSSGLIVHPKSDID